MAGGGSAEVEQVLKVWLDRWALIPDGEPFLTPHAKNWLLPVRREGQAAMLKLATSAEEIAGAELMDWWAGDGAARVLVREGAALLLERLPAKRSLVAMAAAGEDLEALRILCAVAERLHQPRGRLAPESLRPLAVWLRALTEAAENHGGLFRTSLDALRELSAEPVEAAVLHGDLHHQNVLDGGERGWLVIDPKGVWGDRGYDYAAMLCNPHGDTPPTTAQMARQVEVVADSARLERGRLLRWLLVHAGASAVWCIQDGFDPKPALAVAEVAAGLVAGG
jgi:streptomycin 6-kinase